MEILKNGTVSKITTGIYVGLGMLIMIIQHDIPQWYIATLLFIALKVLFRYEKCTVSYIEVKLRGVPKEDGYLYNFLKGFQRLRENVPVYYTLLGYTALVTYVYFFVLRKTFRI